MTDTKSGEITRGISIYETGEQVTELGQPEKYAKLRKLAIANYKRKQREDCLKELGLTKVKGSLGGTYWE